MIYKMMISSKKALFSGILLMFCGQFSNAQNVGPGKSFYQKQMKSLHTAISENFYDKASGYYVVVVDSSKRENKDGYLRKYTYLWSLCALYQAANEIEKIDAKARLMEPLLKIMNDYYSPAPPKPGYTDYIMKLKPGERYYDDNEWIGITALDAFARTKLKSQLDLGKLIFNFIMTGYDDELGGGFYWKEGSNNSKNTCSNGPGILVALQLYQATHDKAYLDVALKTYNWTNANLQAPSKLYYDNIRTKDRRIGKTIFSYNTGTMLEANLYLYECTGERKYLKEANGIADSSLAFFYGKGRFRDGYWFNAVLLRAYQHLLKYNNDTKYVLGFKQCLDASLKYEKNNKGLFTGKDGVRDLVDQGGMLEILARYALLETQLKLKSPD
jgi:hypothetical protein